MEENNQNKEINNGESKIVKNPNRKSIPLVSVIAILVLITVIIVFLIKLPKMLNKDENKNEDSNNIIVNSDANNNYPQNNATNNVTNEENNVTTNVENSVSPIEEIKNCLKNDDWVKEYLSYEMEEDLPITRTFYPMKDKTGIPIIIIKAVQDDDIGSMQGFMVTYKNGKVISSNISNYRLNSKNNQATIKVNLENGIVGFFEDFDSGNQRMMYSVFGGIPQKLDTYGFCEGGEHEGKWYFLEDFWRGVPTVTEDKYNRIKEKYDHLEFKEINTELTSENVDQYVE